MRTNDSNPNQPLTRMTPLPFPHHLQVDGSYHLALFSIKPIKQGQELTWDYNFAVRRRRRGA